MPRCRPATGGGVGSADGGGHDGEVLPGGTGVRDRAERRSGRHARPAARRGRAAGEPAVHRPQGRPRGRPRRRAAGRRGGGARGQGRSRAPRRPSWRQTGGGAQDKAIDPAGQARRCKYALRKYDNDVGGADAGCGSPTWSRCRRPGRRRCQPDRLPALDGRRPGPAGSGGRVVTSALQRQEPENPLASDADVEDLLDILTGRPGSQRETVDHAAAREAECDLLTRRQARSWTRSGTSAGGGARRRGVGQDVARGRAGRPAGEGRQAGRTLLLARPVGVPPAAGLAAAGRRAAGVRRGVPRARGRLGRAARLDDDSDYWERRLPEQMAGVAQHLRDDERYDAFVVDEGQDFADSWWPALVQGLRDRGARWAVAFADEGQRVFARQAGRRSSWCRSRWTRTCATPSRSRRRSAASPSSR